MKKTKYFLGLFVLLCCITTGCKKDDAVDKSIILKVKEISLYSGETYQIDATSHSEISYSSENEYHASVSSTGLVKAIFVGETNIVLSNGDDTKRLSVSVKPKVNLYPDPELNFGMSKNALIGKYGTPTEESENMLLYDGFSNAAPFVMYLFDDNNKLSSSGVMVKTAYSSSLGSFLSERYLPVSIEDLIFANALEPSKATMAVVAQLYNLSYWLVVYAPYKHNAKSRIAIQHQCEDLKLFSDN